MFCECCLEVAHHYRLLRQRKSRQKGLKNFDLFFRRYYNDDYKGRWWTKLERSTPFNQVLPLGILLGLWPWTLARANKTTLFDSHSSLDFVFFLLKEKNDVFFQNIRLRLIRKRKQFHFEEYIFKNFVSPLDWATWWLR